MFKRVPDLQQAPVFLRAVPNERLPFQPAREHLEMFGLANEGWKIAFGQVFAGVSGSDRPAAIVDYDWGVVEVGHGVGRERAWTHAFLERGWTHASGSAGMSCELLLCYRG